MELVNSFCNSGDVKFNASDGNDVELKETTKVGWIKFSKCVRLLHNKSILLKTKIRIHPCLLEC